MGQYFAFPHVKICTWDEGVTPQQCLRYQTPLLTNPTGHTFGFLGADCQNRARIRAGTDTRSLPPCLQGWEQLKPHCWIWAQH